MFPVEAVENSHNIDEGTIPVDTPEFENFNETIGCVSVGKNITQDHQDEAISSVGDLVNINENEQNNDNLNDLVVNEGP